MRKIYGIIEDEADVNVIMTLQDLKAEGYEIINNFKPSEIAAAPVLFFITSINPPEIFYDLYRHRRNSPSMGILPMIFKGGEIPDLLADIKYADFRQDSSHALALVLRALTRL